MKVEIKQTKSKETLTRVGNKFFTKTQLDEIARA